MSSRKQIGNTLTITTMDDPVSVQAQYSPDKVTVHTTWLEGDLYMRTRKSDESAWSSWHLIVGENGGETDYSFYISAYPSSANEQTAPADIQSSNWQDTPMQVTDARPYLWMRTQKKAWNSATQSYDITSTSYVRINGESLLDGDLSQEWYSVSMTNLGETSSDITFETTIHVYYGSTLQTLNRRPTVGTLPTGVTVQSRTTDGNVTFKIAANTSFTNDRVSIPITATCAKGSVTKDLLITGIRGGAVYQLVPSASEVVKHQNGTFTPSTNLTCSVSKITNGITSTPAASEYTLKMKVNGGSEQDYAAVAPANVTSSIVYVLYVGGVVVDRESVPLVTDGIDGTNPIFADLTNEMDSVSCNKDGVTTSEQTVETTATLWKGSTQQTITGITVKIDGTTIGSSYGSSSGSIAYYYKVATTAATGAIKLYVRNGTTIATKKDVIITVTDGTNTRDLTLTINGARQGANGEPAAIYSLIPSANQVVKHKDGTYTPSVNLTCSVTKNVGGTQSTPAASEYTLKMKVNGGSEQDYAATSPSSITSNLVFILYVGGVQVDKETIPLITDGDDGVSITSSDIVFGLSTSETTAPSPDNPTTWKTSIAALSLKNSDKDKYIWQCTKITYSSGNTVYTGKMCLGIVSSFADIVEQYALGTASAATGTWQDTTPPAMANGYYLWTRTKLVYSDNSVSYAPSSNGYCVGYYGVDGTSITGANVWYALSTSNSSAPQDSAFTLDDFPTTLNAGYYVWEATKITFSSGSPIFTGKMCLGATSDFLSGTEVYAISTSNSTAPADNQFGTTYSKTKGYYLWTATRVQYTDDNYAYLNKKCVGYWGEDGTSPYFADLNNEMDAIQCNHDGGVIADQTVSTVISMWKGSAVEAFVIDNIYRNGTQLTWGSNSNGVKPSKSGSTVSIDFDTNASIADIDDFKITIYSYNDNTVTRELHFTINGVRANAIYRLVPSHSQIVKKKDGTYVPSVNITCAVEKTENGFTSTPSSSEYTLEKSVNGGTYEPYSVTSPSSITSDLKFRLKVGGVVVDLETIPLVSDGDKGNTGDSAPNAFANPAQISIPCYSNGNVKAQKVTSVIFSLKVGANTATVTSCADGTKPTGVTVQGQYNNAVTITVGTSATASGLSAGVTFTVTGTYGGKTYSATVTVALIGSVQGEQGEQGDTGERGKVGRFFYYAGVFDANNDTDLFVVNDAQAPFFLTSQSGNVKTYHVFDYETNGTYTMADMWDLTEETQDEPPTKSFNNAPWEVMTNDFKYLITEAMFAEYAKFGSAIFSGDWMISQQGKIDGMALSSITAYMVGSTVSPYTVTIKPYILFDANHPLGGVASKDTYQTTISSSETSHNVIGNSGRKAGVLYKVTSRVKDGTTFSGTPLRFQIDKNGVYYPITLFTITEEETDYTAYFMVPENNTYRFRLVRDSSTTQSEIIISVVEQVCFETQYAVDLLTGKSYFSNAYVKGSITYPSLVIDTDNYSTYIIDEDANSYLQLSNVTETNIYIYYFPSISYSSVLGYHYAYVALPEITEEMIGKEITICNATTDALTRTDLAIELRIISHGTISGTGLSVDIDDPKGLLVTRLSGSIQWSGAVPPYRTESNALKVPLQHEVRLRAANKNMWVAVGAPYSIIGE